MKLSLLIVLCLLPLLAMAQDSGLKDQKQKLSYSLGLNIGANLKSQGIDIDPQVLARGISDVLSGTKPAMTEAEVRATLEAMQTDMKAKQDQASGTNKKAGQTFLAENSKKPGVVTLPSGLQYKILKPGTGPKPKATDTVVTHYKGTLLDGTEFDSSYKRNEPAVFPVNGVIKGWTEALQLMPVGSKWQLFIPAELAYGEKGAADVIGPNQTLIFEVELISIKQ
jgi:FKBP-type peptidyl-prolyl cis-trans isomerase FklB